MKKDACAICELVFNTLSPATNTQQVFGPNSSGEIMLCRRHDKEVFLCGQDAIIRNYWDKFDFDNQNQKKIIRIFIDIYEKRNREAA